MAPDPSDASTRGDTVHFADSPDFRAVVWPAVIEQALDAADY